MRISKYNLNVCVNIYDIDVGLYFLYSFIQGTEELFRKEANLTDVSTDETQQTDSEVSSVLSAYKSEGDPALYEKAYSELKKFVESSLDIYKVKQQFNKTHKS